MQVTGLSRMTIYWLEIAGQVSRRRQLIGNSVAWLESDIETWAKSAPLRAAAWQPAEFPSTHQHQAGEAVNMKIRLRLVGVLGVQHPNTSRCGTPYGRPTGGLP